MRRVAYYKGAWPGSRARARLFDPALAPKLGLELVELRLTCCGAGDIQTADPTTPCT